MEFFEARNFTKLLSDYLDEEQFRSLQQELGKNPEAGDVVPGTGGFRKLRWGDERRGKGKRGGLRIIYYWFERDHQIWLTTIFGKDEASDLTPAEKKVLKGRAAAETEAREMRRIERKKQPRRRIWR